MALKKSGGQQRKSKLKSFRALRMMKRGWAQPDEKMKARITEAAIRKAAAALTTKSIEEVIARTGALGEMLTAKGLAAEFAHLGKEQQRIALTVVSNAAIKYALDTAGITDRKKRAQVSALMKEAMETMLLGTDAVSKRHSKEALDKAREMLGARGWLFIRRYLNVSGALISELEKSGVFKAD